MYDLAAVRAAHPIVETVRGAGISLARSGARWRGRCPFHEDRDPSLVLYPQTESWFCYSCHVGGDVIDFVARLRGLSFKEAVATLAVSAVPLPSPEVRTPPSRSGRHADPDELAAVEAAVAHYARSLTSHRDVRAYLARRGVSLETARRLRLGYAAGGLADKLARQPRGLEVGSRLGLLSDGRDAFAGRLIVPDLDARGGATWLVGRRLAGSGPRYLNLHTPTPVLGLAQARRQGTRAVVVVEGPFDWITACEWAIPAVALLGTHASRRALRLLATFRVVYLVLDSDKAGQRAARAIADGLGERAKPVELPRGVHDLNELGQRRQGRETFLRALAAARA